MANPAGFDFGYYHAVGICEGEFPQLTIALNKKMNEVLFPKLSNQQRIQNAIAQLDKCIRARIHVLSAKQYQCIDDWKPGRVPLCKNLKYLSPIAHLGVIEKLITLQHFLADYPPDKGQINLYYSGDKQQIMPWTNKGENTEYQPTDEKYLFRFPKNHFGEELSKEDMTELRRLAQIRSGDSARDAHYNGAYEHFTRTVILEREVERGKSWKEANRVFQEQYGFPVALEGGRRSTLRRKRKYRPKSSLSARS
jgi:hypothetical protein